MIFNPSPAKGNFDMILPAICFCSNHTNFKLLGLSCPSPWMSWLPKSSPGSSESLWTTCSTNRWCPWSPPAPAPPPPPPPPPWEPPWGRCREGGRCLALGTPLACEGARIKWCGEIFRWCGSDNARWNVTDDWMLNGVNAICMERCSRWILAVES